MMRLYDLVLQPHKGVPLYPVCVSRGRTISPSLVTPCKTFRTPEVSTKSTPWVGFLGEQRKNQYKRLTTKKANDILPHYKVL